MAINSLLQLKLLLDLYFSDYNAGKYGTIRDISKDLAEPTGHVRNTLASFEKNGIFKTNLHEFKRQNVKIHTLLKDEYLEFLFSQDIVKKIWMILYHNGTAFTDLINPYSKEEFKEIKETLKELDTKKKLLNI